MRPLALPVLFTYGAGLMTRGVEVVGKLALYILVARLLGAYDAGLFFLCLTWIGLGSVLTRLGLERALTRHIAAELAVGHGTAARQDLWTGLGWSTLVAVAMTALTALVAEPVAHRLFDMPDLAWPLMLSALAMLPQTLTVMLGSVLAGLKRGVAAQFVQSALWPALTLAALLAGARSLTELILVVAVAMTLCVIIAAVLIARSWSAFTDRKVATDQPWERLPGLWQTARPLFVVEMVQVSLGSLPVLGLGIFAPPDEVGAFSVATRISILIWVLIISIGTVVSPLYAERYRLGQFEQLRTLNVRVMLGIAGLGVPVIALMMMFPVTILALVGNGFETAATALVIMAAGQLVNCLLPCQDVLLAMTGHGRWLRHLNLAQLATCILLGAVLIPAYGMTGAAALTAICIAQGAIGTTLMARRLVWRRDIRGDTQAAD